MSLRSRVRMLPCLVNDIPGLGGPCPLGLVSQLENHNIIWEFLGREERKGRKKKIM
jgi:hypothetical protein